MRTLLLLRGSPACGKTTWIKNNNLSEYALSADNIRLMCQTPIMLTNGNLGISQSNDKLVWKILFQMLEARMQRGEFTVIDATNSKTTEMNRYKELASTYRYRIYCVDFTKIPIEQCRKQNQMRQEYKQVPDSVFDKMYARFATQKIPSGITVLKPDELNQIWFKPIDLSNYKVIHHIGDIHGCNTVLQEYLKDGIKDDEYYIFTGDYIDRGIENAEVVNYLFSIMNRDNVCLLEGNHEHWLWAWGNKQAAQSREFQVNTKRQLEDNHVSTKEARMFYRKLRQCAYYIYNGKTVLVTHGGISKLSDNLSLLATEQMIKGVGTYEESDAVDNVFMDSTDNNTYQIHGHRNLKSSPVQINSSCFNLEGSVEFGDKLRIVELSNEGFKTIELSNTVFKPIEQKSKNTVNLNLSEVIEKMRKSKFIIEKKFDNISSFNFTRDAFYDKQWDEQTTKARGLYIDTVKNKVVARAYDKFFNINERPETKIEILQHTLNFPVYAYRKENGFLGIVGYNDSTDDLFITTKSSPDGEYAQWFKKIFYNSVDKDTALAIKDYIKENNVSFVFEVIDVNNDPHIIKYVENHMALLDIVKNDIDFNKYDYTNLQHIAHQFGLTCKVQAYVLNNWQDFYDWYNEIQSEDYEYDGKQIEGFVIEDSNGFMVKTKLDFYRTWKFMRSVMNDVFRKGYITKTSALTTPLTNKFYGWLKAHKDDDNIPKDIISLRDLFYKDCMNDTTK